MAAETRLRTLKDDRRTQKTKKLLAEALKELILEKGYDAITVQDLIDKANIGRSTFYAHYESKEQLLLGNVNFQKELIDTPADDDDNYPMGINLFYLFNHTKENLHLIKALSGSRSLDVVGDHFAEICMAKILAHHKARRLANKKDRQMMRYKAAAVSGGIVRMLYKWLEDGAIVPVEVMVAQAGNLLEWSG